MLFLLPRPCQFAKDAISNALMAQQCGGAGTIRMVASWMSQEAAPHGYLEGLLERNARNALLFQTKFEELSKCFPRQRPGVAGRATSA
jgi:hypothetical protein